jgi:hypothetical protein
VKTVAQINSLLSAYLPLNDGHSSATSIIPMLNQVMPRLYDMGNWRALQDEIDIDASNGYFCLPEDYESIIMARLNDIPVDIQSIHYEYQKKGPGYIDAPVSFIYGLIDEGFVPTLSDLPIEGLDAITFTLVSGTWDASDSIRVDYITDTGKVVWNVSLTGLSTITLTPASPLVAIKSIQYTSMPDRVVVSDADDIIYAVLIPGSNVSEYRRYKVPQVPPETTDEWSVSALVKKKFQEITANTDVVYIDNITVLKHSFLAITAEDNADLDRANFHWSQVNKQLELELSQSRGGAKGRPQFEIWGAGIPGLPSRY